MIYQIRQYVLDNFPPDELTEPEQQIIVNSTIPQDDDELIVLRDMGGLTRTYPDNRQDGVVQVYVRARDDFRANELSGIIFNILREKFRLTLSFEGQEIYFAKIGAIQRPTSLGINDRGLYEWVTNYETIFVLPLEAST